MASRLPFETDDREREQLLELIFSTPQLRAHVRKKWTDCEEALVEVLTEEGREPADAAVRALARLVLESPDIAARESAPGEALAMIFANLRRGWGYD
jgi:hypothetical protein